MFGKRKRDTVRSMLSRWVLSLLLILVCFSSTNSYVLHISQIQGRRLSYAAASNDYRLPSHTNSALDIDFRGS